MNRESNVSMVEAQWLAAQSDANEVERRRGESDVLWTGRY